MALHLSEQPCACTIYCCDTSHQSYCCKANLRGALRGVLALKSFVRIATGQRVACLTHTPQEHVHHKNAMTI